MKAFITSYHPLCKNAYGRSIADTYGLAPFLDASIRREPDFQAVLPTISALCRLEKLVGRIKKAVDLGQEVFVIYVTVKSSGPRKLVAILRVERVFSSHEEAKLWYWREFESIPTNCMVSGNPACPLEFAVNIEECRTHRQWDEEYWERSTKCGTLAACSVEYLDLWNPPHIPDSIFKGTFPGTRNPKEIGLEGLSTVRQFLARQKDPIDMVRWEENTENFDPFRDQVNHSKSRYADSPRLNYSLVSRLLSRRFRTDQWLFASADEPLILPGMRKWNLRVPRSAVLARIDSYSWTKILNYPDCESEPPEDIKCAANSPNGSPWRGAFGSDLSRWVSEDLKDAQYIVRAPLSSSWIQSAWIAVQKGFKTEWQACEK